MKKLKDIELGYKSVIDVNEIDLWLAAKVVEMDDLCLRSSNYEIMI